MYRHLIWLFCAFVQAQPYISLQKGPCAKYDTPCVTKTSNNLFKLSVSGDPSANIHSLEPLKVKHVEGKFVIMNYHLYNNSLVGLTNCNMVEARLNLKKNSMKFKLVCPYLYMSGLYEVSGILIVVPIEGNGDYNLDTKDYLINVDTETSIIEAENKRKHLHFKSFTVTGDVRGGMTVDLKNLFNGKHKELADAALKFANEQWKPVANEFQGPILTANIKKVLKNMNKFLKKIPMDELFTA